MTVKVTGRTAKVERILTGMYSFDKAFENDRGEKGFPIGTTIEMYGAPGIGKSTLALSLAGMLAQEKRQDISLADLEGFDPATMVAILESVGFDGEIYCISEPEDEIALQELAKSIQNEKKNYGVAILDAIGAISPIEETENDLGSANMGRRGRLLAQFSRRLIKIRRDNLKNPVFILINHQLPIIGGRGVIAPGGETKNFLAFVRIQLKRKEEFPDGSYVLEGKIKKNRYGYRDGLFYVFMLAGKGLHKGMTCLYDGILTDLVERKKVIRIGEISYGSLKGIVQKAKDGDDEFFEPFVNLNFGNTQVEDKGSKENENTENKDDGNEDNEEDNGDNN